MQQKQNNNNTCTPVAANAMMQLYDIGFKHRLLVPMCDILFVPKHVLEGKTQQPMLCQRNQFCFLGSACNFVHARVNRIEESDPGHVNFAWKTAKKCKRFERFPEGKQVEVAYPAEYLKSIGINTPASQTVPSEYLLKTHCLEHGDRPTMCMNFMMNRICPHGAACQYAHVIHIDSNAKPHQRAPLPAGLTLPAVPAVAPAEVQTRPCMQASATVCCPTTPTVSVGKACAAPPLVVNTSLCSEPTVITPRSGTSSAPPARRYRHNPYAARVLPDEDSNIDTQFASATDECGVSHSRSRSFSDNNSHSAGSVTPVSKSSSAVSCNGCIGPCRRPMPVPKREHHLL